MPKERTVGLVTNRIGETTERVAADVVTRLLMGAEGFRTELKFRSSDSSGPFVLRREFCLAATDLIGTMASFGEATTYVMHVNKTRPVTDHGFIWLGPNQTENALGAYRPLHIEQSELTALCALLLDVERGRPADIVVSDYRNQVAGAVVSREIAGAMADLATVLSRPYLMAVVMHPRQRLNREQARTLGARRTPALAPDPADPFSQTPRLGRFVASNLTRYLADQGVPAMSPRHYFPIEAPLTYRRKHREYARP